MVTQKNLNQCALTMVPKNACISDFIGTLIKEFFKLQFKKMKLAEKNLHPLNRIKTDTFKNDYDNCNSYRYGMVCWLCVLHTHEGLMITVIA